MALARTLFFPTCTAMGLDTAAVGSEADLLIGETIGMKRLIADRGYDANRLRPTLRSQSTIPVFPGRKNRKRMIRYDEAALGEGTGMPETRPQPRFLCKPYAEVWHAAWATARHRPRRTFVTSIMRAKAAKPILQSGLFAPDHVVAAGNEWWTDSTSNIAIEKVAEWPGRSPAGFPLSWRTTLE